MTGPSGLVSRSENDPGPSGLSKKPLQDESRHGEPETIFSAPKFAYSMSEPSLADSMEVENDVGPPPRVIGTQIVTASELKTEAPALDKEILSGEGHSTAESSDTVKASIKNATSVSPPFAFSTPGSLTSALLPNASSPDAPADEPSNSKDVLAVQVNQAPFIQKLYSMVEEKSLDSVISWSPTEDSFRMNPGEEFSKTLCLYFKHTNITSFVRQLSMYSFHKVSQYSRESSKFRSGNILLTSLSEADSWEFKHADGSFRRNDFTALRSIKRRSSRRQSRKWKFERHVVVPQDQRCSHPTASYLPSNSATQSPHRPQHAEQTQVPQQHPYPVVPMMSQVLPRLCSPARVSLNLREPMAIFPSHPTHQVIVPQLQPPPHQLHIVQTVPQAASAPVAINHVVPQMAAPRTVPPVRLQACLGEGSVISPPAISAHVRATQVPQIPQNAVARDPSYSKDDLSALHNNSVSSWISSQSHNYMVFPELSQSRASLQALPHPIQGVASVELINRVLSKQRELEADISSLQQHVGHLGRSAGELGLLVQLITAPLLSATESPYLSTQTAPLPNIARPHAHVFDHNATKEKRPYISLQAAQLSQHDAVPNQSLSAAPVQAKFAQMASTSSANGTYLPTAHPAQSTHDPTVSETDLSVDQFNTVHGPNGLASSLSTGEPMTSYKEQPSLVQPRNLRERGNSGDTNDSSNSGSNSSSHREFNESSNVSTSSFNGSTNDDFNGDSIGDSNEDSMIDNKESSPDREKSGPSELSTSATSGCSSESFTVYQSKPERVQLQALLN